MLQTIMSLNWLEILGAASVFLSGCLVLAQVIPGDQPDKALQAIVDLLKKFSVKK